MNTRCRGSRYLFCFSLSSGLAQQNPPESAPPTIPNRRITLDVVVTDKSGTLIPGLQQQDFTLLDNKQPQRIASLDAVPGGTATAGVPVEVIVLLDEVNTTIKNVAFEREQVEKFFRRNGGQLAARHRWLSFPIPEPSWESYPLGTETL